MTEKSRRKFLKDLIPQAAAFVMATPYVLAQGEQHPEGAEFLPAQLLPRTAKNHAQLFAEEFGNGYRRSYDARNRRLNIDPIQPPYFSSADKKIVVPRLLTEFNTIERNIRDHLATESNYPIVFGSDKRELNISKANMAQIQNCMKKAGLPSSVYMLLDHDTPDVNPAPFVQPVGAITLTVGFVILTTGQLRETMRTQNWDELTHKMEQARDNLAAYFRQLPRQKQQDKQRPLNRA